jgi:multiple sugar transport system substrate-binding protein
MSYFSERETGERARDRDELDDSVWGGIRAIIRTRIEDGSFGAAFADMCTDGRGPIGTDENTFWQVMQSEIPNLGEKPWHPAAAVPRGGALGNADGTVVTFTDPKGMEAFELFRRFGEAGQAKIDMTDAQVRQSFAGGKIGIHVDSSSSLDSFLKQAEGRFEIGTAHLPFAESNARLPTSGIAVVLHTTESEQQKAAWKFMRFVVGPKGQTIVGRNTGYVPANEVALNTPELLGDYYKDRATMNAALASVPYAAPWFVFNGPNTDRIDKLFVERLQQVVTLRQTPQEVAVELSNEISALIAK